MNKKQSSLAILIQTAQPLQVLIGVFAYVMGLGLADYLGKHVDGYTAILGGLLIVSIIGVWNLLKAYFHYPLSLPVTRFNRRDTDGNLQFIESAGVSRIVFLEAVLGTLALAATVIVLLIARGVFAFSGLMILVFGVCLMLMDVLPPIQLCRKGGSELVESFLIAIMSPALAYLCQEPVMHFLLALLALPLFFLYLSFRLAISFEYFDYDMTRTGGSMLARVGWQHCVAIHNLSILGAFLLVSASLLTGFPWSMVWPILLALPLGGLQIIQMISLADGKKPNWKLLWANALGTVILYIYLAAFTLWIK